MGKPWRKGALRYSARPHRGRPRPDGNCRCEAANHRPGAVGRRVDSHGHEGGREARLRSADTSGRKPLSKPGSRWALQRASISAVDKARCERRSLIWSLRRLLRPHCEMVVPSSWLDDSPPDIGVREPRRPRPEGGAGTALLEPPL
jgi:hypothetical protein